MYTEQLKDFLTCIILETDRKKTYIAQARLPVERVSPESNGRLLLAPRLPDLPPHQDAPPRAPPPPSPRLERLAQAHTIRANEEVF